MYRKFREGGREREREGASEYVCKQSVYRSKYLTIVTCSQNIHRDLANTTLAMLKASTYRYQEMRKEEVICRFLELRVNEKVVTNYETSS